MRDVYANPSVRRLARAIDGAKPPAEPAPDVGPECRPTLAAYYACGLAQMAVYLLAGVPTTGIWYRAPAARSDVPATPAIAKARAPFSAASRPCARRAPKSTTGRPAAAATTLAAWRLAPSAG
jgi:hypothetical protein